MLLTYVLIVAAVIATTHQYLADDENIMLPFLNKEYKLVSSDKNFDKVLKILDIGWLRRKAFEMVKPKLTLAYDPTTDIYTFTERGLLMKIEVPFQLGRAFIENTLDGRSVQELFTLHGTTLVETQRQPGKPTLVIERIFSTDHVIVKVHISGITSHRIYDAV